MFLFEYVLLLIYLVFFSSSIYCIVTMVTGSGEYRHERSDKGPFLGGI